MQPTETHNESRSGVTDFTDNWKFNGNGLKVIFFKTAVIAKSKRPG